MSRQNCQERCKRIMFRGNSYVPAQQRQRITEKPAAQKAAPTLFTNCGLCSRNSMKPPCGSSSFLKTRCCRLKKWLQSSRKTRNCAELSQRQFERPEALIGRRF